MRTITYAAAICEALAEEMERDEQVFLIGEDIGESGGVFGVTKGLFGRFGGERVLDTPISEEAIVGAAVGAALLGGRPVAEIMFSDFATLAMDMIVNQAAKTHYMTGGRLTAPRHDQARHRHGRRDGRPALAEPRGVVHPHTRPEVRRARDSGRCEGPDEGSNPRPRSRSASSSTSSSTSARARCRTISSRAVLGQGRIVREGTDVTVVAYLKTLHEAVAAAETLAGEGVSVEVFDPRSLVPFDREGLRASLEKTGRLVIAHEAPQRGGFGAEIAAIAAGEFFDLLHAPVVRVCGTNTPMPYAPELEGFVIPNAARIADGIRSLVALEAAR